VQAPEPVVVFLGLATQKNKKESDLVLGFFLPLVKVQTWVVRQATDFSFVPANQG